MPAAPIRLLLVDDDAAMRELITKDFAKRGFAVSAVGDAGAALDLVEAQDIDVIVTDVQLGGVSGLELTERLVARLPDVPVLVITAFGSAETVVAAMRAGAHDFVAKPFALEELALRVRLAAEQRALHLEVRRLREARSLPVRFEDMVGDSAPMQRVFALVERLAASEAPVLVLGETGTGKELAARAIHARSRRAAGPFVAINCAAMPESLLESELFGHVKGAFTDARGARAGLFLQASRGTLFLDEVGEMPLVLQAKLLRALQEKRVRPVGSDQEVSFDARIVAATHRDLEARIGEGAFREDLFYRLHVLALSLPPLRERGTDVLVLAQEHLRRIAERDGKKLEGIAPEAARRLLDYAWPGNVRELVNAIERAAALAEYDVITVTDLPEKVQAYKPSHLVVVGNDASELVGLDEVERRYILRVLEVVGGNRSRAAEVLRIDRKTLYSKLKSYGHSEL